MIGRGKGPPAWSPFGRPGRGDGDGDGEDRRDEDEDLLASEPLPLDGGTVEHALAPADPLDPPPQHDPEYLYHPAGPRAPARDERGRLLPGTSGAPERMIRPGGVQRQADGSELEVSRWSRGARGAAFQERRRLPFAASEVDHAIADRLRERLDAPEPHALDRLALFARRVVADAIAGRPYAAEAILDRLQPEPHPKETDGGQSGIVLVTQVVGPGGANGAPQVYDLRTGFEGTEDDE